MPELRRSGFRLGIYHGKQLLPQDTREYALQRDIYAIGRIRLNIATGRFADLRVFAYEVPLYRASRSESVDILAYDREHNLWIVEVKAASNHQPLDEVEKQVQRYISAVTEIKDDITREFKSSFLFDLSFKRIRSLVLAPRGYFSPEDKTFSKGYRGDIRFGYLAYKSDDVGRLADSGGKLPGFVAVSDLRGRKFDS